MIRSYLLIPLVIILLVWGCSENDKDLTDPPPGSTLDDYSGQWIGVITIGDFYEGDLDIFFTTDDDVLNGQLTVEFPLATCGTFSGPITGYFVSTGHFEAQYNGSFESCSYCGFGYFAGPLDSESGYGDWILITNQSGDNSIFSGEWQLWRPENTEVN